MSQVSRDGDYILVTIPDRDIESMIRYIAHNLVAQENLSVMYCHDIVTGDLTKQDEYVKELKRLFDLENFSIVLDGPEALALCDELAEKVYEAEPVKEKPMARICVYCHKAYLGNPGDCQCPESKRALMRLVK